MPGIDNAFQVGGVNCWIDEDGGVVESWGSEGFRAEVAFRCAWSDRLALALALRGGITAAGSALVTTPPFRYPDAPGLACTALGQFRPEKLRRDARKWAAYEYCVIPATFTVPTWTEGEQWPGVPAFTTISFNGAPEVFSPPGGAFYMPDLSASPVSEATIGLIRPHVEISIKRSFLPYPPVDADMFLQGMLNDEPVRFADHIFPRGCLMYLCMAAEPQSDPSTGTQTYECTFKLIGNYQVEFNEFLGSDGDWHFLNTKSDGTGDPPFLYGDFRWFFGDDLAAPAPVPNENVTDPT